MRALIAAGEHDKAAKMLADLAWVKNAELDEVRASVGKPTEAAKQAEEARRAANAKEYAEMRKAEEARVKLAAKNCKPDKGGLCFEEEGTRRNICFEHGAVRANGRYRSAPLIMGGPAQKERTSHTAVVDCEGGAMELRDRQGVVYAREQPAKLYVVQYRDALCNSSCPKQDSSLR